MSPHSACSLAHSFLSAMLSVLQSTGSFSQQGPPVNRVLQSTGSSSQQCPPVSSVLQSTGSSSQQGPPVDRVLQSAVSSSQQGPPVNRVSTSRLLRLLSLVSTTKPSWWTPATRSTSLTTPFSASPSPSPSASASTMPCPEVAKGRPQSTWLEVEP